LDAQVSYNFNSGGQKTIYFRLTYTDGSSYTSQTNVVVADLSTLRADVALNDSVIIPATTQHSGGKIQILYASSNTTGQLRKPLIIAEGFDAYGIMPNVPNRDINDFLKIYYPSTDYGTINLGYSGGNLMNNIDFSQYDIVYVDNKIGTDDIRRNAKLFEQAIDWVNAHKAVGNQPNVVMGLSMGGLVARYALRSMEVAGKDHQTWKFISVDAPHKGANVPVSVQAAVRQLEELDLKVFFVKIVSLPDVNKDLKGAVDLLNSKAAKQMLVYQVTKDLTYNNSEYTAFMQEYDNLGFPQQCQNVAIADGNGQGTPVFNPESGLVKMDTSYTFAWWLETLNVLFGGVSAILSPTNYANLAVVNPIPGKTQVYASVFANALPDKKASKIYEGKVYYKKTILWLIPVTVDIVPKKNLYSTADMLPIDGAQGGLYDISAMMNLSSSMSQYVLQQRFCFVPTVSALGLSNWKDKLTSNLQNEDFFASGTSGFDQYFTPATNELHTRLNLSAQFLYTHLTNPAFCFNPNVSSFCGTNSSAVKNPSNYPLTWSVSSGFTIQSSNNTGATVVPQSIQTGILTCKYNTTTVRKRLISTCNYDPCSATINLVIKQAITNIETTTPQTERKYQLSIQSPSSYFTPSQNDGDYFWTVSGDQGSESFYGSDYVIFYFSGYYKISLYYTGDSNCGPRYLEWMVFVDLLGAKSLSLSPNPASTEVTVEVIDNDNAASSSNAASATEPTYTVQITDMSGTPAYNGKKKGKKFNLSVSSLKNGVYNVIVADGAQSAQKKLIVNH